ncbi:MAG: hypothetical protein IJ230_07810, partial [Clostridia bacterium]|nr:hypothetical protein [Clostridia bacterium]
AKGAAGLALPTALSFFHRVPRHFVGAFSHFAILFGNPSGLLSLCSILSIITRVQHNILCSLEAQEK